MCVCVYKTTKIVCLLQKLRGKKHLWRQSKHREPKGRNVLLRETTGTLGLSGTDFLAQVNRGTNQSKHPCVKRNMPCGNSPLVQVQRVSV